MLHNVFLWTLLNVKLKVETVQSHPVSCLIRIFNSQDVVFVPNLFFTLHGCLGLV